MARWILTGVALFLIVLLYMLPKVVVDNEQGDAVSSIGESGEIFPDNAHNQPLSEAQIQQVEVIKEKLAANENPEKNATFADSLAGLFAELNYLDSAAYYYGKAADWEPVLTRQLKAGDAFYQAFSYAVDLQQQRFLGEEARKYLDLALAQDEQLSDAKVKKALTYIPQETMKGVTLLREAVQTDPDNELGLYHLGLLSMQSRQFDRAVERFENLVRVNPQHLEGQFYLGVAYFESGARDKALNQFRLVQQIDNDPEVQAAIDEYLKELN